MHELPVTKSILNIVLRHADANGVGKVVAIDLSIGALSDLEPEWLQSYFDHLSRGTVAEGARIEVERTPVVFRCGTCECDFPADLKTIRDVLCPSCGGKDLSLVSGREFFVKEIEVL